jgi:hypothetical protein
VSSPAALVDNLNADLLDGHDDTYFQRRVSGTCAADNAIREIAADGTVTCQAAGPGTITGVTAGQGLSGGGTSGSVTLDLDWSTSSYDASASANDGTSSTVDMISTSAGVCFLSKVEFDDTNFGDGDDRSAGCRVYSSSGTWKLEANDTDDDDDTTHCSAICVTWP